jgi:hypothetical protein
MLWWGCVDAGKWREQFTVVKEIEESRRERARRDKETKR